MDSNVDILGGGRSSGDEDQPASDSRQVPVDVGLVFALTAEAGGLIDRLDDVTTTQGAHCKVYEGTFAECRVAVIVASAVGSEAAGRATGMLIQGHRPRWVISAGFAGGLDASVEQEKIFLADQVTNAAGVDLRIAVPAALVDRPRHASPTGRLLSMDRLVRLPNEKRRLGRQYAARAVDMETWTVVDICLREQMPVLSVRVISDTVDEELPEEIERVVRQPTSAGRAGAVIGALWRRPGSVKDLWRLQETALRVSDRLATALEEIVRQLP